MIYVQKNSTQLLKTPSYIFKPVLAMYFDSPFDALVYNQLRFRADKSNHKIHGKTAIRFSYSALAEMFSCSRVWMIATIKRLENKEAIEIYRDGGVNKFIMKEIQVEQSPKLDSSMLVFPELLKSMSLIEAIFLQQIHIRQYKSKKIVVKKILQEWQADTFPFLSLSTVKRTFKSLQKKKLIFVQTVPNMNGYSNAYGVNYSNLDTWIRLANL